MTLKILSVFGTRPEAIKMAPLALALGGDERFDAKICVTGQHREMLDQVLELFELKPDFDLNIMKSGQDLTDVTTCILQGMKEIFRDYKPDVILVHGDTATTFATTLAAYYQQIPVAHIEAGLRTGNLYSPWPEEANRKLTGALARLHFAPTESSKQNLVLEGVPSGSIHVTGNTVIDALLEVVQKLESNEFLNQRLSDQFAFLPKDRRVIFSDDLMLNATDIRASIGSFMPVERMSSFNIEPGNQETFSAARERFDRQLIESALAQCGGKVIEAAARLGLGRSTLYKKMVALGIAESL